ncbi:response regulator [Thiolinea disciformis]|uniref:response regulator n=1 Tax=Thiolinea disciformis TaxID=125614 RepID=UPI000370D9A7|nr:response regulator [Thiolinea disciformis]
MSSDSELANSAETPVTQRELHKRLQVQCRKSQVSCERLPDNLENWRHFLHIVNRTYESNTEAQSLLERSLEISSREMNEVHENLRRESEQRIEALHQTEQKTRFMTNMSHELRTPIHGILGSLEVLRETSLTEHQRLFVDTAYSSCEAMLDLVKNILDFTRIRSGSLVLENSEFSPREMLENISQLMTTLARDKAIEVLCFIPEDIPEKVSGDPARIRQILLNLCSNAVQFTQKGEVFVGLEILDIIDHQVTLRFEVRDSGCGIPVQQHDKIFEFFMHTDDAIGRKNGGAGLGLAIAKELTEMMHSTIKFESTPNVGSHFWFDLKLNTIEHYTEPNEDLQAIKGRYILVVDDNKTHQFILRNYLKSWKANPIIAGSGLEALQMMRNSITLNEPFYAILLDWSMPDMDGLTWARSVRSDHHYDHMPIILMAPPTYQHSDSTGVQATISKPVRTSALKKLLLQNLGKQSDLPEFELITKPIIPTHEPAILLAEDNPVNALIATTMLEGLKYRIDHVVNGKQAFDAMTQYPYHLILMDINMPEMNGYMATEAIREWEKGNGLSQVPILALTANALQGDFEKCIKLGMNDYLPKPVKKEELLHLVKHWLEKSPYNRAVNPAPSQAPTKERDALSFVQFA